jgi:rSAM/selenodomain-associated transferase 1
MRGLRKSRPVFLQILYEGGNKRVMEEWLGPGLSYSPQSEGDLGDRMVAAFDLAFCAGATRVIIAGTDCPELTEAMLVEAFEALGEVDAVLGPARDGGYYLIGLRKRNPELFVSIPWGTDRVLKRTEAIGDRLGLSIRSLMI